MIIVDTALARRADEGRPIRVGLVGAGFMGGGVALQLMTATRGMELAAIASRRLEAALDIYRKTGREPVICKTTKALRAAIESGRPAVTEDALALAGADGIDVVFEITGSIEHAAQVAMSTIDAGKHFVLMNAELDGTVGPLLNKKAVAAGVVYTFSDGDQPGVQMNLFRFVRGIGVTPVLCGNIKGLHDPYRNPTTQEAFARKWGQKPAMVASFADGTKISFEQAIVANGTGMRVARRGMHGPDLSGGDPNAPQVPLQQAVEAFTAHLDAHLAAGGPGLVDYVVGAHPNPGVFVLGSIADATQRHFLNLYKLGTGPYYLFYVPYHLCHFEGPSSIARAALFGDPTLAPVAGPQVGVVAVAKKDLAPGETVSEFGGYECYGVAENYDVIDREGLLPIGLALGCTLVRAVTKDAVLTLADVSVPEGRTVDRLYAEQKLAFAGR